MNSSGATESKKVIHWVEGPATDIARRLALEAVGKVLSGRGDSDRIVDLFIRKYKLKGQPRSFFTNLTYGTIRMKGSLDWVIEIYSRRKMEKTEPVFANILRLGAFQILYTDGVPPYAAVDESVELARTVGREWAAPAVNAILRRIADEKEVIRWPTPSKDLLEHIKVVHSYPEWLVKKTISQYGQDAHALLRSMNEIPKLTIRVNSLRKSPEHVFKLLQRKYGNVERGKYVKEAVHLEGVSVTDLRYYLKPGSFHVQDEGAMLVSILLKVYPGAKVLDMCAAPGGKTSHIYALGEGQVQIWAADRSFKRLKLMKEHMRQMGVRVRKYIYADMRGVPPELKGKNFDRILVDAPCTGTGTIRRNPEIKWRRTPEDLDRMRSLQIALLRTALQLVKDDGLVLYSTCSIFREENEDVVEEVIREGLAEPVQPDFGNEQLNSRFITKDSPYVKFLPHLHDTDGFFVALLRRK